MPLTKRTVFENVELVCDRGAVERGTEQNVSSHVGNTRFGGDGTRGDALPDPLDGAGETDTRFVFLSSSGFLSGFTFGFGDGDGERGGAAAGAIFATCVSRATSLPVRDSEVATSVAVLARSSSPSSISITSIVFSSRYSASAIRFASRVLELKNDAQPDTFVAMDVWMGLSGSMCTVGTDLCVSGASFTSAPALLGFCACAWPSMPSLAWAGLDAGIGWLYESYQDHGDNQLEPRFSSLAPVTADIVDSGWACEGVFETSAPLD